MPCPHPDQLSRAASGSGEASERQEVLDHAASCPECRAALIVLGPTAGPGPSSDAAVVGPGSPEPAAPLEIGPGQRIDRYRLVSELGRGAMGVVYAARDPELDRDVAVKVLRASASAVRLKREAQALARLAHPNVVRVYDVGDHEGHAFVAMELVRGSNLRQWLRGTRDQGDVLTALRRAGEGLAAAHRAGLVHRDVKPDNVFVADDGGVLVGDFGLARSADPGWAPETTTGREATMPMVLDHLTATGAIVGTPAYMAPEQNEGEATPAADQYGFCVMAWEALYGQRPIQGKSLDELRRNAEAGAITAPPAERAVPARIERALRRGLSPSPEARFPSMDALLAELAPPPRRRWWAPLALAALAAGGAVVVVTVTGDPGANRAAACTAAAAAIDADWTPALAARVGGRVDASTSAALAHYVGRWRERRAALCRATDAPSTSDPRIACLERARVSFRQTVAAVDAASTTLQPDAIVRVLPALERCETATPATTPPAAIAAAVAALDERIAAVELGAFFRVPRATRAQVAALADEARALGFAPQLLRVQLLDGIVAGLTADEREAIAIFRAVMVAAETAADDFTRARAGAHLALVLARLRDPETLAVVTSARAALVRAGQDPPTEILLHKAEAAFAFGRGDFAAAAAAQERIIELTLAQLGPDAPNLGEAYAAAAGAYGLAGDQARSAARSRDLTAFAEREHRAKGLPAAADILAADTNAPFIAGDFVTVREIAHRQLAFLRALPVQEPMVIAQILATLARASDLDGDVGEALRLWEEVEAILRRPLAEIAGTDPPDPAGVAVLLVDSLLSQGGCLIDLGQPARAVTTLREAEAEALKGGATTAADLVVVRRYLGQALSAAGEHRDAITLLAPIVDGFPASTPKAYARGMTAFALARSLWAVGGVSDRARAHALVQDAERELKAAVVEGNDPRYPATRIVARRATRGLAELAAWRDAHPVAP